MVDEPNHYGDFLMEKVGKPCLIVMPHFDMISINVLDYSVKM